jgi:hypothetical protein
MKLATWTTYAALTAAAFAFAPAANAGDATLRDCTHVARQVSQALETAEPGNTKEAALTEQRAGHFFCMSAKYDKGVAHYNQALQLLGKG